MENETIANILLLFSSCGGKVDQETDTGPKPLGRVFECKTCNRRFSSFQALGGHQTSHKKQRIRRDRRQNMLRGSISKPRAHACPVCGLEFPMGQALGGHMRRHKPMGPASARSHRGKGSGVKKVSWLDLNLLPEENELELQSLGFGEEEVAMVNYISGFRSFCTNRGKPGFAETNSGPPQCEITKTPGMSPWGPTCLSQQSMVSPVTAKRTI